MKMDALFNFQEPQAHHQLSPGLSEGHFVLLKLKVQTIDHAPISS
jgi:hypothetical protein